MGCLGDAEVDHFRQRLAIHQFDQHIRWLDIPMDHASLMSVVDGVTYLAKEFQTLPRAQTMAVAIFRNGNTAHVLHGEIRHAALSRAGIQHARDIRMVHHLQRLAFGFEACDYLLAVEPVLDDFECDLSVDRLPLLGEIDGAHSALSQKAKRAVWSEPSAGFSPEGRCAKAFGSGFRARLALWADTAIV